MRVRAHNIIKSGSKLGLPLTLEKLIGERQNRRNGEWGRCRTGECQSHSGCGYILTGIAVVHFPLWDQHDFADMFLPL